MKNRNNTRTTSRGTKYTQETRFENIPANAFETPTRVASGILNCSVYLSIRSFDTSSEVKAKTLPGNEPTADVPNPLKMPGIPSALSICLKTDIPFP